MLEPQPILEINSNVELYLSPNGQKLVWHGYDKDHFTVYDLISKEQGDFPWQASWQSIRGWRDEDTVSILVNSEEIFDVGRTEEYVYFDLPTGAFISQVISLNLPGYPRDGRGDGPLDGFAVIDPTESVVLYTRYSWRLILIDRTGGKVLWEHESPYVWFPLPDWTSDGKRVAFVLYDAKRPVFHTLTQDGKTSEIIGEGDPPRIIRDIQWSPDEKYIYYAYWNTVWEGPAFIIDMATRATKEICTPGYTIQDSSWLQENQLAYIAREGKESGGDGIAEVRITNIDDWTSQTIFRTASKIGPTIGFSHELQILGWTPLSNP